LEEAAAKRPPVGPDPFGGVGLYGGEPAPTAEGGLASMLPERKPSMQRTEQRGMGTRGDAEPEGILRAISSLFGGSGVIDPVQRREERKAALADRDKQAEGTMAHESSNVKKDWSLGRLGDVCLRILVLTRGTRN
jgi:hypothetical protein